MMGAQAPTTVPTSMDYVLAHYGMVLFLCIWLRATPNKPLREQLARDFFRWPAIAQKPGYSQVVPMNSHQSIKIGNLEYRLHVFINLCQEMIARRSEHLIRSYNN